MAIKFGYMPNISYTKIDNNITRVKELSDGAVRYYVFVAGLPNGKNITDTYVAKALSWSVRKVQMVKKELSKYDLILTETIHRGLHYIYVGNTKVGASTVKEYVTDDTIDEITLEDIESKHNKTRTIVKDYATKEFDDNMIAQIISLV